jgi:hypothetical protein
MSLDIAAKVATVATAMIAVAALVLQVADYMKKK